MLEAVQVLNPRPLLDAVVELFERNPSCTRKFAGWHAPARAKSFARARKIRFRKGGGEKARYVAVAPLWMEKEVVVGARGKEKTFFLFYFVSPPFISPRLS